ncbi:MAG TPA: hypothetical protein VIL99_01700 [Ignavibacteria bacterium]
MYPAVSAVVLPEGNPQMLINDTVVGIPFPVRLVQFVPPFADFRTVPEYPQTHTFEASTHQTEVSSAVTPEFCSLQEPGCADKIPEKRITQNSKIIFSPR